MGGTTKYNAVLAEIYHKLGYTENSGTQKGTPLSGDSNRV